MLQSRVSLFKKMYHLLEIPAGPMDQKKPVPVPILREFVCRRLRIGRDNFDARAREMCEQGPEEFILSRPRGNHRKKKVRMKGRRGCGGYFFRDGFEIRRSVYRVILCRDRERSGVPGGLGFHPGKCVKRWGTRPIRIGVVLMTGGHSLHHHLCLEILRSDGWRPGGGLISGKRDPAPVILHEPECKKD